MKKIIALMAAVAISVTSIINISAIEVGKDVVFLNVVNYTDIIAYINDLPIRSYNIGGYTVIVAEDLKEYDFDVTWNAKDRTLSIERKMYIKRWWHFDDRQPVSYKPEKNTHKVGEMAMPVLYTDIKTYLEGTLIRSHNIGGRTVIYLDDIAEMCGYSYTWDNSERKLELWISRREDPKAWSYSAKCAEAFEYENPENIVYDGLMVELTNKNKSSQGESDFEITDFGGAFEVTGGVDFSHGGLSLSFYQNISSYIGGGVWNALIENVHLDARIREDTPENRKLLARGFRIYINGESVGGELAYLQGNGHSDYLFAFDKPYYLEEIDTIRLEIGSFVNADE